jgi:hypothetical protein
VFVPKTEKAGAGWRKLRIEELIDIQFSPGIIRAIKSRRMK